MLHFMSRGVAGISWKRPELLGACCEPCNMKKAARWKRPFRHLFDFT